MFMDGTATSNRLETLTKVLMSKNLPPMEESSLKNILAPQSLPDFSKEQPTSLISAGKDLGLIKFSEKNNKIKKITASGKDPKQYLLEVLDEKILSQTEVEPYFAKFFSYALHNNIPFSNKKDDNESLASLVNQEIIGFARGNPFNYTKISSYLPWYSYMGLTQPIKSSGSLTISEAYPYERIKRKLHQIFKENNQLFIDDFMQKFGSNCPELDGGEIYKSVTVSSSAPMKELTLGVSNALIELHISGHITLDCPLDSDGWSFNSRISIGSLPDHPTPLKSNKIYSVTCEAF